MVPESLNSELQLHGFKPLLCYLLSVQLWAGFFITSRLRYKI